MDKRTLRVPGQQHRARRTVIRPNDFRADVGSCRAVSSSWTEVLNMSQSSLQKIVPSLWYAKEAEEAARFYTSLFPDSRIDLVTKLPADSPSGPAGSVVVVQFTIFGHSFQAMSAGP